MTGDDALREAGHGTLALAPRKAYLPERHQCPGTAAPGAKLFQQAEARFEMLDCARQVTFPKRELAEQAQRLGLTPDRRHGSGYLRLVSFLPV